MLGFALTASTFALQMYLMYLYGLTQANVTYIDVAISSTIKVNQPSSASSASSALTRYIVFTAQQQSASARAAAIE